MTLSVTTTYLLFCRLPLISSFFFIIVKLGKKKNLPNFTATSILFETSSLLFEHIRLIFQSWVATF